MVTTVLLAWSTFRTYSDRIRSSALKRRKEREKNQKERKTCTDREGMRSHYSSHQKFKAFISKCVCQGERINVKNKHVKGTS